ncbi:MAG: sensor histidine kinase [Planctomycetota bacterium]
MKSNREIDASYSRLRPVVLLLIIAVVLPTVCLLWFMTQAVKNERLAVRQKLVAVYEDRLVKTTKQINDVWSRSPVFLTGRNVSTEPYQVFISAVVYQDRDYDGLLIYDNAGERVYPLLSSDVDIDIEPAEFFSEAWKLEFTEQNFAKAARLYQRHTQSDSDYIRFTALLGQGRCLEKIGQKDEAVALCKAVAFAEEEKWADGATLALIGNARLLLMKFIKGQPKHAVLFGDTFNKLISIIYSTNEAGASLSAEHNLFLAQKVLEIREENMLFDAGISPVYTHLKELIAAEQRSIDFAEYFLTAADFGDWRYDEFRRLWAGEETVYGLLHKAADQMLLLLLSKESIASAFEDSFKNSDVAYRILDGSDNFVTGIVQADGKPFVTAAIGGHFPGWKAELYLKGSDVFENAASRQASIYIWTGTLVIVLILTAGGFAGQAIGKQIKLNRLKNDFIATVSHELKTPLSSMRVLVDTLMEGTYEDEKTATEYFQLISKENERLSRLIDNFLTFSRMERNKKAFEIVGTNPAEIAKTAAEAVQTKFNKGKCKLDMSIDEGLPEVLADKDAMVTVLVNLLDNGCKYSDRDRQIVLKVFAEDASVCFSVRDNGIGLSRRAVKKIFNRFYQVDRSLTRRTQGTGLGLAIVKFIVDAHKGKITVDSKPGKGSTFTVKLPAGGKGC